MVEHQPSKLNVDGSNPFARCSHLFTRVRVAARLLFAVAWLFAPVVAYGWGEDGHCIAADIAARELTPETAARVKELLDGQSLADVSTWADEVRRRREYQWSAPLHYVNVPPEADGFEFQRDCPTGECVVGAIHRFIGVLRDPVADHVEKAEALKFLVHFVGDVHQPLHVSYARDKGGNDTKVEFLENRADLHAVWDTLLIRAAKKPWREYAGQLYARITPEQRKQWAAPLDPSAWATESYRLAVSNAYAVPKDGQLGKEYLDRNLPVVEERLSMAGIRLGALLNAVVGDGRGLPVPPPVTTRPATAPSTMPATVTASRPTTMPSP